MNDKFKYAPGKPGFGTQGKDGSLGLQGLGMYFTDFDPTGDTEAINIKIAGNLNLWKSSSSPLPDERTYSTGDLFFDQDGNTYEINAENNTFLYKYASLNSGGFFIYLGVDSTTKYKRYYNTNISPKILIDNVYTTSAAVNYTASPLEIYGIGPKEFTRIEFSNVGINGYNPFTVYSSGISSADDASSIAIVRSIADNTFRIGNLDNNRNLRNVNLTFDVSSLRQTKQAGNAFNKNTPPGTVLTNYEIAANSLFTPAFNPNPTSFTAVFNSDPNRVVISWNLADFTNDTSVKGDLYFLINTPYISGGIYSFFDLTYRPLTFQEIPASGSISITQFPAGFRYDCYIKIKTLNGWTRNSVSKTTYWS